LQKTTPKKAQASISTILSFLTVGLSPVAIYFSGIAPESIGLSGLRKLVVGLVMFNMLAAIALNKGDRINA